LISNDILENVHAGSFTKRQHLFFRYSFAVLIDLTVLNLFNEFWDYVFIEFFSTSLLAAILLQVLLKLTIAIEHHVAGYFNDKPGLKPKILRGLSAWAILFVSKLIILEIINLSFGKSFVFSGPIHGLVAFLIVVTAIIIAEQAFAWVYRSLGKAVSKD
jgi:hypothetical protein